MKAPSKQAVLDLPVPQNLLKRIHTAELMIMEESMQQQLIAEQENNPNNAQPSTGRKEEDKSSSSPLDKPQAQPTFDRENSIGPDDKNNNIKENIVTTDEQNLQLLPLKVLEDDLPQFLQKYQARVNPQLHQSYCPLSELLEKSQAGYTPHWLCLSYPDGKDQQIEGLAVFYIDPSCKARTRVTILHATVAGEEAKISDLLSELLKFIWSNINCDEIRVGLAHVQQEGEKMIPYDPLKNAYQDLKFRWKTLTNDDLGNRILILGMNRPENCPLENMQ